MDINFPICHLFYYPTQVVLVDDDPDFLDAVSLLLRRNLSYRLFRSAAQALIHVNNSNQQTDMIRRCYSSYKTGPFDSDTLNHIDINEIYKEVYNPARFSTPTVVVVDYSMPEMNGLEFCMSLTNPYVKKILLTGQADTDLAVQAFNEGLIDQYISKKDQHLQTKLNRSIANLQQHYFSRTFKLITDPVIANNQSRFINNPDFVNYFREILSTRNIVEYYLIDEPYSGFFLLDEKGTVSILLILQEKKLQNHYRQCVADHAPNELLQALANGSVIPLFNVANEQEKTDPGILQNWRKYYVPAARVSDRAAYHCAMLSGEQAKSLLRKYHPEDIAPYSAHINAPQGGAGQKYLH